MLLVILIVGGYAAYNVFFKQRIQYDPVSACPVLSGQVAPRAHTVILIDETDTLTDIQADQVRNLLQKTANNELQPGELLSIYVLGDDFRTNRRPIFEMCKIRDGSDADALTENEKLMRKRFRERFQGPLMAKIDTLLLPKPVAKQSPLMEMVQSISVNSFDKWMTSGNRRLIVVSDMIQNVRDFTMFKSQPEFEKFNKSPYAQKVKTRLPDTSVELYYLSNYPKLQTNRNAEFWRQYFNNSGAMVEKIIPIGR